MVQNFLVFSTKYTQWFILFDIIVPPTRVSLMIISAFVHSLQIYRTKNVMLEVNRLLSMHLNHVIF